MNVLMREEERFAEEARERGQVTYKSDDNTVEDHTKLEDEERSDLLTEGTLLPVDVGCSEGVLLAVGISVMDVLGLLSSGDGIVHVVVLIARMHLSVARAGSTSSNDLLNVGVFMAVGKAKL